MESTATGWPRVCILWRGGVSCPVSAAWYSCVAGHWSKYHSYKQAPSRCLKATLNPNKQTKNDCIHIWCSWLLDLSVQPASQQKTRPLLNCPFTNDWVLNANYTVNPLVPNQPRPIVTSFRAHVFKHVLPLDNKSPNLRKMFNLDHLLISDLFLGIMINKMYIHPITYF